MESVDAGKTGVEDQNVVCVIGLGTVRNARRWKVGQCEEMDDRGKGSKCQRRMEWGCAQQR